MSLAVFLLEMVLPFFLPQNAVRIEVCGEVTLVSKGVWKSRTWERQGTFCWWCQPEDKRPLP